VRPRPAARAQDGQDRRDGGIGTGKRKRFTAGAERLAQAREVDELDGDAGNRRRARFGHAKL
jgi:hypothetical protein